MMAPMALLASLELKLALDLKIRILHWAVEGCQLRIIGISVSPLYQVHL